MKFQVRLITALVLVQWGREPSDSNDEDKLVFFLITKILNSKSDASVGLAYSLPPHRRCVWYSLNLFVTFDISKITNWGFLKIFKSFDLMIYFCYENKTAEKIFKSSKDILFFLFGGRCSLEEVPKISPGVL